MNDSRNIPIEAIGTERSRYFPGTVTENIYSKGVIGSKR